MKKYNFYGYENAICPPINPKYEKIKNPQVLYELLSNIWCEYSCAPRLRPDWSKDNMTLGQCSITSFLVQDIFGGEVYGVRLLDGAYHCFNVVDGLKFDLTSEQFGDEKLDYDHVVEQTRESHFACLEKYERYQYLVKKIDEWVDSH